jgi:hypothetical protein
LKLADIITLEDATAGATSAGSIADVRGGLGIGSMDRKKKKDNKHLYKKYFQQKKEEA